MSSSRAALVAVENVTKRYMHEGREVLVLRGIDLVIEPGEMLSVVGQSGAGKSTLLHLLGTLDLPTSGRILYGGADVTRYSSAQLADFRNQSIGFVFQFHHLLPEFTALENVMMPGLIRGEPRGALEKRARELLAEVGLSPRLTHRPGELSGGEQQRVALARALVMRPKLVLADEPTGNLDSKTSASIHELFFGLNESRGTTFLIVTHSLELAGRMPRIVRMSDGLIVEDSRTGAPDYGAGLPEGPYKEGAPPAAPPETEPKDAGAPPPASTGGAPADDVQTPQKTADPPDPAA